MTADPRGSVLLNNTEWQAWVWEKMHANPRRITLKSQVCRIQTVQYSTEKVISVGHSSDNSKTVKVWWCREGRQALLVQSESSSGCRLPQGFDPAWPRHCEAVIPFVYVQKWSETNTVFSWHTVTQSLLLWLQLVHSANVVLSAPRK